MAYRHHDFAAIAREWLEKASGAGDLAALLRGMHSLGRAEGAVSCRAACNGEAICSREDAIKHLPSALASVLGVAED